MIQKRNRFSTNSQKSKKIALDFQPLANPKIENMKRRFILPKRRNNLGHLTTRKKGIASQKNDTLIKYIQTMLFYNAKGLIFS